MTIRTLPLVGVQEPVEGLSTCEHRTVSKDGRIVCAKIVDGDSGVSPEVCRTCPVKAINCGHLRFSLCHTLSTPLVVRYNGRTEIWDDGPAELRFEHAACAARVMPIENSRVCAGCSLRQATQAPAEGQIRRRRPTRAGIVVPFPQREAVAATG
jgi:hypothetical protein